MLELRNLNKRYSTKNGQEVHAINDISLTFEEKGMVFLLGKSGSGKSTMLNLIGGLDTPDSGEIIIKGKNCNDFTVSDFDSYRNTFIGFVFQDYNLLEEFTLEENIELAFSLQGKKENKEKIKEILELVDLADIGNRKPNTLSGGQKQRIAIARALIKDPEIIMADEPTGALDSKTGKQIFDLLKELSKTKLVIVVSHDREFAERYADRIIELKDGRVVSDHTRQTIEPKKVSENVSIIEGKTAVIKNVKDLTENDLKEILTSISQDNGEAVITAKKEELENVKQVFGISEQGGKRNFVKTGNVNVRQYSKEESKFIASKLPLTNALKMGISGLKSKPIRLVFTIFLSVLAFCMFGVLSTLMLYKPSYTLSKALRSSDYRSIIVSRGYEYHDITYYINEKGEQILENQYDGQRNVLFSSASIDKLNANKRGMNFAGVFNLSNPEIQNDARGFRIDSTFDDNDLNEFYKNKSFFGFSDVGMQYLVDNGIEILAGEYPEEGDVRGVLISDYIANMLIQSVNHPGIDSYDTALGKIIEVKQGAKPIRLEITGVFKASDLSEYYEYQYRTKDEEYNALRLEKLATFSTILNRSFETLGFVDSSFYEAFKAGIGQNYVPPQPEPMPTRGMKIGYGNPPANSTITLEYDRLNVYTKSRIEIAKDACKFYNLNKESIEFELEEDEIFLSESTYKKLLEDYSPSEIGEMEFYAKNHKTGEKTLKVKGYYSIRNAVSLLYIVHDNLLTDFAVISPHSYTKRVSEYVNDQNEKYNYLISPSKNTEKDIDFLLQTYGDEYFSIVNGEYQKLFSNEVMDYIEQIKHIFIVVAIIVGVFAGLMLLNFISASITAKRKEIGILRAVGATGKDVLKIFACESAVLTIISFIIASLLAFIMCLILNGVTIGMSGLAFCKYGVINVFLILVISVSISFVATIMPVTREAKKSPVESIRKL